MPTIVPEKLITVLLQIGEIMLDSGAEVLRVEDTINRIGYAYGAASMNVFAITSSIVITMETADGHHYTQTKRIRRTSAIDLGRLEAMNDLSRSVCANPISTQELEAQVRAIGKIQVSDVRLLAGYVLCAAAFAIFFGGALPDAIFAAFVGGFVWLLQKYVAPLCMNAVVSQEVISFLTGFSVAFLARLLPGIHQDMVMIGVIMLLIPGVAFTNSLRDILLGDTLSGILRMIEALLLAGTLALGFILAIWVVTRCMA